MEPGDLFAERFEVEALAGKGGMGEVYRARDRHDGALVALKLLHDDSEEIAQRFTREGRVLSSLRHPAIVRYVTHGRASSGELYLAMEWLEGETLAARLGGGGLSIAESVELCSRISSALAVAHAAGVVHRDIKPANIMLAPHGLAGAKLVDFGIARARDATQARTRRGDLLGSPGYMAPEQARGDAEIDERVDIFALGCVLFECVAGRAAFVGNSVMAVLAKVLLEDAPRLREVTPAVPPALDALVARMLAKAPAERPRDMSQVAEELGALGSLDASAPASMAPRAPMITMAEQRLLAVLVARFDKTAAEAEAAALHDLDEDDTLVAAVELPSLRRAIAPFAAELVQLVDGSLLAYVVGAGAATDQAAQAARAALALREALPGAHIGLAMGRGTIAGSAASGEPIDRAARLASAPSAGILIDDVTAHMIEARFATSTSEAGTILLGEIDMEGGARALLGRATPCVGRDREIAQIEQHFEGCADERVARAFLVTAPPGMGKSRLCSEAARVIARKHASATIWVARCEPMRAKSPLGLVASLVTRASALQAGEPRAVRRNKIHDRLARHLTGEDLVHAATFLGELLECGPDAADDKLRAARQDPALLVEQIRRGWQTWLRAECAHAPLLVALEDLHWADAPSVRLLDATLRNLNDSPLLLLAFARPEVHDTFPKLWRERDLQEMTLRELGRKACEALVSEVLGNLASPTTIDRLVRHAAGNAFFLEELIRAEAEGRGTALPETVLAMAQARIERLPAEARRVLRAGSVLGERFWAGSIDALLGAESAADAATWLEALVEREVLSLSTESRFKGEREFAFRHALFHDAAYATLTEADRALGHRLAGAWLDAHGESDAGVIAEHCDRGNDVPAAIAAYGSAAAQALQRQDFLAATTRVDRALQLGASGDALRSLRTTRGRALGGAARWAEARAELEAALQLVPEDRLAERAALHRDIAGACFWAFAVDAAREHGLMALSLAERCGEDLIAASTMSWLAGAAQARGDVLEALRYYELAEAKAGGRYFPALSNRLQALYWLGRHEAGIGEADLVIARARSVGDTYDLLLALPALGLLLAGRGRYAESRDVLREAQDIGRERGVDRLAVRALCMEGGVHLDVLDFDGAEAIAERARREATLLSFTPALVSATIDLLSIFIRRGEVTRAEQLLPSVSKAVAEGAGWHGWVWGLRLVAARAELALLRKDPATALVEVSALIEQHPARTRERYRVFGVELRGRAHAQLGRTDEARADLRSAVELARAHGDPMILLRCLAALLAVAPALALADEARAHARHIVEALPLSSMRAAFESSALVRALSPL